MGGVVVVTAVAVVAVVDSVTVVRPVHREETTISVDPHRWANVDRPVVATVEIVVAATSTEAAVTATILEVVAVTSTEVAVTSIEVVHHHRPASVAVVVRAAVAPSDGRRTTTIDVPTSSGSSTIK